MSILKTNVGGPCTNPSVKKKKWGYVATGSLAFPKSDIPSGCWWSIVVGAFQQVANETDNAVDSSSLSQYSVLLSSSLYVLSH